MNKRGFTLVEMSVVLMIIALVMGAGISLMSAGLKNLSYTATQDKLKVLRQALIDFRIANNYLPCPANSYVYNPSDSLFGISAQTFSYCGGGTPSADAADSTSAYGMVPVRTLGLPDDMAIDGWGRRISYAVSPDYVLDDSFSTYPIDERASRLSIFNIPGRTITNNAIFVLVSHGENGHGARAGQTGALVSAGTTSSNELYNCKCDSNGMPTYLYAYNTFIQDQPFPDPSNPLNSFDDVLLYATRADLRGPDE